MPERALGNVIGDNLKRMREARGWPQAALATIISHTLATHWTRDTVASIEAGRRALSIDELIVLAHVFKAGLVEFFLGDGTTQVPGGRSGLDLERVRALIAGGDALAKSNKAIDARAEVFARRAAELEKDPAFQIRFRVRIGSPSPSEAARRFGVSVKSIERAAQRLWGQSLGQEHFDRTMRRVPEGASFRSVDAIKGHVTRQLLAELREALKKKGSR